MPKMNISVAHEMGRDEACQRLRGFLNLVKERYQDQVSNLEEEWTESTLVFGFTTYSFNIRGQLVVDEDQVNLDGELPFAAMMFKGRIESEIREQLGRVLG